MSHSSKIGMSPGIPNNLLYEKLSMDLVYMGLFLDTMFIMLEMCQLLWCVAICITTFWESFSSYLMMMVLQFSPWMPYVVI